ncbi:MAG: hypothetical protein ACI39R_05355 [Lachnospiraceae bacterium]
MKEWVSKLKSTLNPGILIMLVAGIMLLMLSCRTEEKASDGQFPVSSGYDSTDTLGEPTDETELITYYENKLKALLSRVKGIGEVDVMLSPGLDGACILCEGAGDVQVQSDIIEICGSLFGIPAHKVQILEIEKENSYEGR